MAVAVSAINDRYVGVALRESVAVDVSLIAPVYTIPATLRSVAVEVSVTAAPNVCAAANVLVAVAVSETAEMKVKSEETLSVAVDVSAMLALKTLLPSDENGACENVDRPNTRHAPLISSCCQISFSKPALLDMTINISPLNQI